jgi:hypothetical protein
MHAKMLQEDIVKPVQLLNLRIDIKIGEGRSEEAERLNASLTLREIVASEIVQMPGLDIAATETSTKPSEPPQYLVDEQKMPVIITAKDIEMVDKEIRKGVAEKVPSVVGEIVSHALDEKKRRAATDEAPPQKKPKDKNEASTESLMNIKKGALDSK